MKFAKMFFIAAMAATVGMTACSKDEGGKEESNGKKSVLVTIKGEAVESESRTVGDKKTSGTVALTNGKIIFTNGQEIVTHVITIEDGTGAYDKTAKTVGQTTLSGGATFAELDPTTQKVYLIGNYSGGTITEGVNLKSLNITQVSQSKTDGSIDNVTIFGGAALVHGTENNYTATFTAKPVISRMEIEEISLKTGSSITDYKVTGIFINRYYNSMTLLGAVESSNLINNLSDQIKYAENGTGGSYVTTNKGAIYDYDAAGLNTTTLASGKAYAYNCLALPADDGTMVSVVIRLSGITLTGGSVSGDRYLTIRNFYKDPGTAQEVKINSLERGNIYTITDVSFDENDFTTQPEMSSINATVTATIMNWKAQVIGFDFN